jgi:glycosyltransferase involved in cell wall biosynthesis
MHLAWIDYLAIKKSGLFDEAYYLRSYPDCRRSDVDPLWHFLKNGYKEGRNPSANFDTTYYLESNPDVLSANINPLVHYLRFGKKEGRLILPAAKADYAAGYTEKAKEPARQADTPIDRKAAQTEPSTRLEQKPGDEKPMVTGYADGHADGLVYGIDSPIPKTMVVGKGAYLLVRGWCFSSEGKVAGIQLKLGEKRFEVYNRSIYRDDVLATYVNMYSNAEAILHSGFWGLVLFDRQLAPGRYSLELNVTLAGGEEISKLVGEVSILAEENEAASQLTELDPSQPKLAICMATYNPPLDLFRVQVQSIINQSFSNWICIVNDDHSRADIYEAMQEIVGQDRRFLLFKNEERLGHYYNFESALRKVPHGMDFIAFSDQDDEWYPDKLFKCLAEFKTDEDQLVYCDMDILSNSGEKVSETYWFNRENNYTSMQTLLYANTVTGAASIFRANLLEDILPFPQKIGDVYHDHWVACVALAQGRMRYIDQALYAYKQHAANAYGMQSKMEAYTLFQELGQYIKQLNNIPALKHEVKVTLDHLEDAYNTYLLGLIVLTKTLLLRVNRIPKDKAKTIRQLSMAERSISGLLSQSARYLIKKGPSLGYELYALRSYAGHLLRNRIFKLFRQTRINQIKTSAGARAGNLTITPAKAERKTPIYRGKEESTARLLKNMMAPLLLEISADQPKRVNLLMATVDFNYIFGGYLAMFNLAQKIAEYGNKTRIVIVEPCDYKPNEWRKKILAYPGLENLFELVETSYNYDRNFALKVNPDDIFMATSCWTAHIAAGSAQQLNGRKIIFFAQEYEPIFFPMSSMHAFSHQSYSLPQYTIFSTELLRQYFRDHQIGIYKNSLAEGDTKSIVINNAIHQFQISFKDISERKKKKFLFYARPEAHAARNLYELGLLGLENAIEQGIFGDEWEFFGIGTIGNNRILSLGNERQLTLLPKVSLKEYLELVPTFDLGMSLMLSPHPSLVPLEMAAAGMPAITNTYENKTAGELGKISSNLIGVEPTIEGLTRGLREGVSRVEKYEERMEGAKVNWPTDWSQVFDEKFKAKLSEMMRNC